MRTERGATWLDPEEFASPNGDFARRRAKAMIRANPHHPIADLPIGLFRVVRVSIPDTFSSIPARLRLAGRTIKGFVSVPYQEGESIFCFTPEAEPALCPNCQSGEGCKR